MLPRVLEPEVMDTAEEAEDYDAMDHVAVNSQFCDDLLAEGPLSSRVLDVGTGTARIPIELCTRAEGFDVVAIDLAEHMLALAKTNAERMGVARRVRLEKVDAKHMPWPDGTFAATVSNSIVHHIPEPAGVLAEMWRVTAKGGLVFVRDLARPESEERIERFLELYAGEPPADASELASYERARELFRASFRAALTVDEVTAMVAPLGVSPGAVRMTSDRHWTLACRKP